MKQEKNTKKWKFCHLCKQELIDILNEDKNVNKSLHYTWKFRGVFYIIWNLRYKTTKEILLVFNNGSNHGYHLTIKKTAKNSKG